MMELQKLLFPSDIEEEERKLYYDSKDKLEYGSAGGEIFLQEGQKITFDTYLNSFSTGKWKKYTTVTEVSLEMILQGEFRIVLYHKFLRQGICHTCKIAEQVIKAEKKECRSVSFGTLKKEGIFYLSCESLHDTGVLYEGAYVTKEMERRKVHLGLNICTFKREAYVERNMNVLRKAFLENPESQLYGNVSVYISDNGQTLPKHLGEIQGIHIVKNKNVGGVGGFTRGILEAKDQVTHIVMMDDDAVILPASIERTYVLLTLLKDRYLDYTVGGALMRLDTPWIQYESGAQWNSGNILALRHNWDMRDKMMVLKNEIENESVEYTGWWYTCIPVKMIESEKLPLPIFIHRDDIEYGLRTGVGFLLLNGICVWHEAFENKMPGTLEYYDIRNLAIVNAIHDEKYGKRQFKQILTKWVSGNIARYRYQYVDLNLRGAIDFCRGIDWLKEQDGQLLHQKIGALNYKAKPRESFVGVWGLEEKDLYPDQSERLQQEKAMSPQRKIWQILTMNGYFLPAKRGKALVVTPYDNVYRLYRVEKIVFMDQNGNGVAVKRSLRQFFACYRKLFQTLRYIDCHYEEAKRQYQKRYGELIEEDFWNHYLEMDQQKLHSSR
ncbi:MAG: glycosyltransferase [Lachnospiraceae bacterium]|nr:glycosyltransferase [Robinsoniella sp.]MDY3765207.1 glycosyltransferase [Lachnospiraceae bacterium]